MVDPDGDALPARLVDEFGRLLDRLGAIVLGALGARRPPRYVDRSPGRAELDRYPAPCPARPPATRATFPSNGAIMNLLPIASKLYTV